MRKLVSWRRCVKVADFGMSCLESQIGSAKSFTWTYRWMAPEMIKEKQHTKKVDVYSYAIVLWEILTGLTPFNTWAQNKQLLQSHIRYILSFRICLFSHATYRQFHEILVRTNFLFYFLKTMWALRKVSVYIVGSTRP